MWFICVCSLYIYARILQITNALGVSKTIPVSVKRIRKNEIRLCYKCRLLISEGIITDIVRQMYGHCHECIQSGHCHDCSVYSVIKDTRTGTPN